MKKGILLAFLFSLAAIAEAQNSVCGRLVSAKDQQPLPYANVAMMRASDTTFLRGEITDEKGQFKISNDTLPTLLRLSAMGYETQFVAVPSTRYGGPTGLGKIEMGDIVMQEGAMLLDMVKVTEKRPLYSVDGEKDLYNVSEDASVQTGNASDVLQNAPGVQVDVEGNITLNGSSVTVWINDRPSHLDGEALRQYIKTLPANSIDRVEVMKNPSAKYGGGGPVINIVTNRKLLKNSFLSFGANGTSRPAVSPWISYVYSNEKFHFSGYINGNANKNHYTSDGEGRMFDADSILSREYQSTGRGDTRGFFTWTSLNASYEFDSMNTLSAWFGAYPQGADRNYTGHSDRFDYIGGVRQDYSSDHNSLSRHFASGGYGGADFTHRFNNEGHQFSISASGNWWSTRQTSTTTDIFPFQPQMCYDEHRTEKDASGSIGLSADYSLPYSKNGEIEAGIAYEYGPRSSHILRDTLAADGAYRTDFLRSDTSFSPAGSVGGYLTWRRQWEGFTIKLGARFDHDSYSSTHLGSPEYDTSAYYLCLLPSVHLSYRTKNMHNFSLGYTLRHNHPSAAELTRYPTYGIESFTTGNPLLETEYIHNLDASWNKYFDKFGSVGVSGSYKANLNQISTINDVRFVELFGRNVTYSQPLNAGDSRKGDISVNCMYRPTAFLNVRLSSGVSDSWYRVQVRPDKWVESEMVSWNVRLRLWAKLWQKLEVFATGYYTSRQHGYSILEIDQPYKGIDLGLSTDLFDRKLSLYLNVSDLFDQNRYDNYNINPYNSSTSNFKPRSRYITFGATLRFGKMELESQAKTGATQGSGM